MLDDNKEKIRELLIICDERGKRSTPPKVIENSTILGSDKGISKGTWNRAKFYLWNS